MEDIKTRVYISATRNKERHFIMVKSSIHKKLKQIKNCMHLITASKYIKQNLRVTKLKEQIHNPTEKL